jgi:ATP-dependent Zn protease
MVFDYGMSSIVASRTMRADNYALSEETKRLRDGEQGRLTDDAYEEAVRLLVKNRPALDRIAQALLERETLVHDQLVELLEGVPSESHSAETIGTVRVLPAADESPLH